MPLFRFLKLVLIIFYLISYYLISYFLPYFWNMAHFIKVISSAGVLTIKIGQILSVRPDICGEKIAKMLCLLRKDVTPTSMDVLNFLDISTKYNLHSLEGEPLACGSIAQVYTAILRVNNVEKKVIFKILKSDVIYQIYTDLHILRKISKVIDYIKPLWRVSKCLEEISVCIIKQTNFKLEKENMELFREKGYNVPIVYDEFCRNNILCMEFIPTCIEVNKYNHFVKLCSKMMSKPCLLHMDLHPGNIIWSSKGPYLIDVGLAQVVEDASYDIFIGSVVAVMSRNYTEFALLFLQDRENVPKGWVEFVKTLFEGININTASVINILLTIIKKGYLYNVAIDERMSNIIMSLVILNGHYNELNTKGADFLFSIFN
jgi:predicted unusual protein kinase regulating ubiquinone biosynthesis (AarF/ABC1/UbiB family)